MIIPTIKPAARRSLSAWLAGYRPARLVAAMARHAGFAGCTAADVDAVLDPFDFNQTPRMYHPGELADEGQAAALRLHIELRLLHDDNG